MSFDFGNINNTMGNAANALETQLQDFSTTMNPNSTADMLKMQQMMQEWSLATSLQSSTVKSLGDALRGIIQKM